MSGMIKFGQRASQVLVGVAMTAATAPGWALTVQSDYLFANIVTSPARLSPNWTLATQGPTLNWQCSGTEAGDCTFSGSLTASVLITPIDKPTASDTFAFHALRMQVGSFNFNSGELAVVPLVDPNGHTVGYYTADIGKWTLTASGSIGAPANPLFMTAYGNNTVAVTVADELSGSGQQSYGGQKQLIGDATTQVFTLLGPGATGSAKEYSVFGINQNLITPYLAYPSTTDPRCKDLSCLDYAAGVYTPNAFMLTFDLISVPAPAVPEPSAALMALAGLGAVACAARRRKA